MGNLTVLCFLSLIVASINSLPIGTKNEDLAATVLPEIVVNAETNRNSDVETKVVSEANSNNTNVKVEGRSALARTRIREGMTILSYIVNLETDTNEGTFSGHVIIRVDISAATRDDPVKFLVEDLEITNVQFSLTATGMLRDPEWVEMGDDDGEGFIEIGTESGALSYHFFIDFEGSLNSLNGFYMGHYDDLTYVAMNLHPTHARRVFPCIDDPMEIATLTMTIDGLPYANVFGNTELNDEGGFEPTNVRAHLWGMIAHDFPLINNPVPNQVSLHGRRQSFNNMENQAVVAINSIFTFFNEWTGMEYEDIAANEQPGIMRIISIPDVSLDWHSISIVGIWEPYIFMEQQQPSAKQRMEAWEKIAEGIARQWFGFAIFPSNWMHEWLISGLGTYAAYEALKNFQNVEEQPDDESLLDYDTLFIANIYQESLLRDGHLAAMQLRPEDEIFAEDVVREFTQGLMKLKAPSLLFMLRNIIGDEPIHQTVQDMLDNWVLNPVNDVNFITTLEENFDGEHIGELEEWLMPYLDNNGYAVVNVVPSANGAIISQRRFCFSSGSPQHTYEIPISFTTSNNPDFDDYSPQVMLANQAETLSFVLDEEEDWVIFNIQGRGYYRVNYHIDLWERIIMALEDPETRETIHPLNRAAILDDALNLARANELDWDIAFRIVLSMEHETEYAPWKAFIRNMEFLKKRLLAMVADDEDLDPDIYLRMVRRTIGSIEGEFGFEPEVNVIEPAMTSLTRGIVMEHACKAGYDPCIAAAVDWFYDNGDEPAVNPDIPQDLRPAVYCTMAMNGDEDVITALQDRLETAPSMYERVVILESLACSQDGDFIDEYLRATIDDNSPYSIEERSKIFIAVAESSFENANRALGFLIRETNQIREHYGGAGRLELLLHAMVDNIVNFDMTDQFHQWVSWMTEISGLDDSLEAARRVRDMLQENMMFNDDRLEEAYEWIDENDATKAAMSIFLVLLTFALAVFNH